MIDPHFWACFALALCFFIAGWFASRALYNYFDQIKKEEDQDEVS